MKKPEDVSASRVFKTSWCAHMLVHSPALTPHPAGDASPSAGEASPAEGI